MSLWPSLTSRQLEPEWMDDPALAASQHQRALRGIARLNRAASCADYLWSTIKALVYPADLVSASTADADAGPNSHAEHARAEGLRGKAAKKRRCVPGPSAPQPLNPSAPSPPPPRSRPLRVLDVACGAGDNVLAMARRAQREGINAEFQGCDLSPTAVEVACQAAMHLDLPTRFFRLDVLREPIPHGFDVLVNTLFFHHLDESQAVDFLRASADAAPTIVIDDLVRSRRGMVITVLATRVLTGSPVVHADGTQSVRAAFTPAELGRLADQANLTGHQIEPHFPERMCLTWQRG